MKIFYLYQDAKNGRLVIDESFPQNAFRVIKSCMQRSWLAAKREFGYPLSPIQEYLLNCQEILDR